MDSPTRLTLDGILDRNEVSRGYEIIFVGDVGQIDRELRCDFRLQRKVRADVAFAVFQAEPFRNMRPFEVDGN